MESILIIINAEVDSVGQIITTSPATEKMVTALKQAIQTYSTASVKVEVIAAAASVVRLNRVQRATDLLPVNHSASRFFSVSGSTNLSSLSRY